MFSKKLAILALVVMVAPIILSACGPTPEPVVIKETSVVIETVIVEQAGEEVVKEVTSVVEVEKVVTATPEPEPTEPPMAAISPDFKEADTYVATTIGDPETLDPAWTYETFGSAIENNVYESLVWFDRERTDQFVGVLATDWSVNDSGDVWTFNVRDGVTFHEGGTLEPHDVAYSIHRALLQDRIDGPHWMTLEAFFGLYTIEDMAMEIAGVESFDEVPEDALVETCERVKAAVVADDEAGTVTYNLNIPTPWFLSMLSNSFMGAVVDQEWMVENGAWDNDCATWVQWHDPAAEDTIIFNRANGTGPYKLDHWTSGEEIVLVANENYWRADDDPIWEGGPSGLPQIQRVVIKEVDEWGTRLAMFEAGDSDYVYVPPQYQPQVEPYYKTVCDQYGENCEEPNPDGYIQVYRDLPTVQMTPAQFNWQINVEGGNQFVGSGELDGNGIPPDFFQDIHVRKAFNYCFDFDTMIKDALNGQGIQAQGPIIAGMMGYREGEPPLYSYDLAKCEEEFKLADVDKDGVPAGEDEDDVWEMGFYFQMGYNTGNDTRRVASEILKAGLEAVNPSFQAAVVGMPWPVLLNTRRAQKLPIYVGGWLEDFHDPHNWVQPFLHSQGAYGRVINMTPDYAEKYDALIEEAAALTDQEARRAIYEEIQLDSEEDAVVIWMYQNVGRIHFQEWIHNWYYNPAYSNNAFSYVYALTKEAP